MITEQPVFEYAVFYKKMGAHPAIRENHLCYDLKELQDTLRRDGVTKDSVDFLYVHMTTEDGKGVAEIVAIDNTTVAPKAAETPSSTNVVPITSAKKDKPRIRLRAARVEEDKPKLHHSYLYSASEA